MSDPRYWVEKYATGIIVRARLSPNTGETELARRLQPGGEFVGLFLRPLSNEERKPTPSLVARQNLAAVSVQEAERDQSPKLTFK
jgi:hypothetical protein